MTPHVLEEICRWHVTRRVTARENAARYACNTGSRRLAPAVGLTAHCHSAA